MQKQSKKNEQMASGLVSWEGYGGLAEAAGKVRKGNPAGTGDLTHPSRTTPAPRWGTANYNNNNNKAHERRMRPKAEARGGGRRLTLSTTVTTEL